MAIATTKELAKPEILIDLPPDSPFNVVRIKEDIRLGQRIEAVTVEALDSGTWQPVTQATSIGPRRIIRLDAPVSGSKLRLRVTESAATPVVSEFAVFREAPL